MFPDRWEVKFHDCPYCGSKQPVSYIWEYELQLKHICGSCQIGELKTNDLRKCDVINGKYI